MVNLIKAEEGKVWKSKINGSVGGNLILLGVNDSLDNYEQVDKPEDEQPNEN